MKLNLACGNRGRDGFVGVDIIKTPYADVVHDLLTFPWPFESGSVDEVFCAHFVEHIPMGEVVTPHGYYSMADSFADSVNHEPYPHRGKDLLFAFFDEMYRVMAVGGRAEIVTPYGWSDRAFQDPTHRRFIVPSTYLYLNAGWRREQGIDHYDTVSNFGISIEYFDAEEFNLRHDDMKAFARAHYLNSVLDIAAYLTKLDDKETL